jgi:hypothetical protein
MFVQPLMGLVMVMASNICFFNHAYSIVRVWAVFQKYIVSFKELLFSSSIGISNDRQHCWAQPDFTKPFGLVKLHRSFLAVEIIFVMLKLVLCVCVGVKPYACTMCDKRFFQRYHLARHSLTHMGRRLLIIPKNSIYLSLTFNACINVIIVI